MTTCKWHSVLNQINESLLMSNKMCPTLGALKRLSGMGVWVAKVLGRKFLGQWRPLLGHKRDFQVSSG